MQKIVSLIPSATDIVCSLGLEDSLVGVSHECDTSNKVLRLPKLTTTSINTNLSSLNTELDIRKTIELGLSVFKVNSSLLKKISPDIIITQTQCSVCAVPLNQVEKALKSWNKKKPKLIDLKPQNFQNILNDIKKIGVETSTMKVSKNLIKNIEKRIEIIKKKLNRIPKKKVLCIEWINPLMIAGNWVTDLVNFAGAENLFAKKESKSHYIDYKNLQLNDIACVIFMPCGYYIKKTEQEFRLKENIHLNIFKNKKKFIVDGNKYFNRPGSNIIDSLDILCEIIHPKVFKPRPRYNRWIYLS